MGKKKNSRDIKEREKKEKLSSEINHVTISEMIRFIKINVGLEPVGVYSEIRDFQEKYIEIFRDRMIYPSDNGYHTEMCGDTCIPHPDKYSGETDQGFIFYLGEAIEHAGIDIFNMKYLIIKPDDHMYVETYKWKTINTDIYISGYYMGGDGEVIIDDEKESTEICSPQEVVEYFQKTPMLLEQVTYERAEQIISIFNSVEN